MNPCLNEFAKMETKNFFSDERRFFENTLPIVNTIAYKGSLATIIK